VELTPVHIFHDGRGEEGIGSDKEPAGELVRFESGLSMHGDLVFILSRVQMVEVSFEI
jgi:hypothetical protein